MNYNREVKSRIYICTYRYRYRYLSKWAGTETLWNLFFFLEGARGGGYVFNTKIKTSGLKCCPCLFRVGKTC
jgi:hypothetical protein